MLTRTYQKHEQHTRKQDVESGLDHDMEKQKYHSIINIIISWYRKLRVKARTNWKISKHTTCIVRHNTHGLSEIGSLQFGKIF